MPPETEFVVVTTTVGDEARAGDLADQIVAAHLAACVQLAPIDSVYRWQGTVERAAEIRLEAKTTAAGADALMDFIRERHEYETPEIVVTPIVGGSADYLQWVADNVGPARPGPQTP